MVFASYTDVAALVGRVALGALFLAHGWPKIKDVRKPIGFVNGTGGRGQRKPDRRPRIRDVRMMVHRLRERAHFVDERERLGEVAERPRAIDRVARARPTGDLAEAGRNLVLGEKDSPRHERGKDHGGQKVGAPEINLI